MAERTECVIAQVADSTNSSRPRKLSFDNGGDFIRQTRREVDEYLSAPRIRTRGLIALYAKGVVAFALLLVSWTTLVLVTPGCARSARLRRTDPRNVADGLLRDARRQSRRLFPDAPPQPPDGLDGRCAARALELRVAREAQRRPSHLHERGRLRRGHHPDAVRAAHASPGAAPVVPAPALLHLGALLHHGAALETVGDVAAFVAGKHRDERAAHPTGLGPRRPDRWEGDLRHLGDRAAVALLSLVGRRRRLSRLLDGREPDHGRDLPASTLRRGGRLRLSGRPRDGATARGRCTRSRPRSTSARTTGS